MSSAWMVAADAIVQDFVIQQRMKATNEGDFVGDSKANLQMPKAEKVTCLCIYLSLYISLSLYIYTYVRIHIPLSLSIYIYISIHLSLYIYIYI